MRSSIQVDDLNRLRENLENLNYKFCYEEVLTQCYFRTVDFKENIKSYVESKLGYTAPTPLTQVTLRCEVEVTTVEQASLILMTRLGCIRTCHDS